MSGILTISLAVLSGVCLYAAVHHLWMGWSGSSQRLHRLFALLSLLVSVYVLAKLGAYRSTSAQALVDMRRIELSMAFVIIGVLPWFVAIYMQVRSRTWPLILSALVTLIFVVNLTLPYGISFVALPDFQLQVLPWGETVADLRTHQRSIWYGLGWTVILLGFVYAASVCVQQYRRGERQRALLLAFAMGVFFVFFLFNYVVNLGLVEFTHTAEFGFVSLILLMSRALSRDLRASGEALKTSEARFRSLMEQSPFGIQVFAPDGRTLRVNRAWETLWGLKLPALTNYNILHDRQLIKKGVMPYLHRGFAGESVEIPPAPYNLKLSSKGQAAVFNERWVRAYVYSITDQSQRVHEVIMMHEDVTERRRTEAALRSSEERLRATLDNTPGVAVQWFDRSGRVLYWNPASEKLYGIPAAQAVGKTMLELLHTPEQFREFLDFIGVIERQGYAHGPAEIEIRSVHGAEVSVLYTMFAIPGNGAEPIFVCMDVDITERKRAEARIRHMAYTDYLTGLSNRAALDEHLAQALRQATRSGQHGAMLLIDLDHFKTINDALSHEVGDQVLRDVARRLSASAAGRAFVARLGGDEFVLVMTEISALAETAMSDARHMAEAVTAVLANPFSIGEQTLNVGASIGIVMYPAGASVQDILRHADIALYRAKSQGRNAIEFFLPSMQAKVDERLQVERGLRQALEQGDLLLLFQPKLNRSAQVVGAEALLRWRRPGMDLALPGNFIPVAEETGLIHAIGQWVLAAACDRLKAWRDDPITAKLGLAVNVSSWQFIRADFVQQVEHLLASSGVNPAQFTLEITESALFYDIENAIEKMRALRALGLRLSMDDFGTGFSSLSYLKKLPLDELKIDRSFMDTIGPNAPDVFLSSIVAIGHAMGMTVVGEGVETEAQRNALTSMGCDGFQGYLWSVPIAPDAFVAWVAAQENRFSRAAGNST